jgi:hypothetical protein
MRAALAHFGGSEIHPFCRSFFLESGLVQKTNWGCRSPFERRVDRQDPVSILFGSMTGGRRQLPTEAAIGFVLQSACLSYTT